MTYLKIINDGLIEIEDLTLIGSSTKRGQEGKIGEFGSGNKFSLAWYFRNNCIPTVFRGIDQMKIDTKVVLHRDVPIQVITVEGIDTSITTNMGPKWNGWMALRETISNALDEGGFHMKTVVNPDMVGEENKTIYYIPMNNELDKVISNFNHYFSMDRTPIFENAFGQIFSRSGDTPNIYRQGIRCWDTTREINCDINLFNININESRLTEETAFDTAMYKFVDAGLDIHTMDLLLTSEYRDMIPSKFSDPNLEVIKDMVANGKTFGSITMSKLAGLLGTATFDYVISSRLYDQLIHEKIIEGIRSDNQLEYVETDNSERLTEIAYYLKAFGIITSLQSVITNKFSIAHWENNRILINANITKNGSILSNADIAHSIVRTIPFSIFETII
jgi:hypothetical protein